jgi:hypothetical protein
LGGKISTIAVKVIDLLGEKVLVVDFADSFQIFFGGKNE